MRNSLAEISEFKNIKTTKFFEKQIVKRIDLHNIWSVKHYSNF